MSLFVLWIFLIGGCSATLGSGGCPAGTTDCNGTCVAIDTDSANCGACGTVCGAGTFCSAGECDLFCGEGQAECAGVCTGTVSDTSNCGACKAACAAGSFCDRGACSTTCSGVLCPAPNGASECAHLETDPDHCGQCGRVCGPGTECQAGQCVTSCPEGRTACGVDCVDLATSTTHCGVCGNACGAGVACTQGSCGETPGCVGAECPCPEGQTRCGAACIDTKTNGFHCGACNAACPSSQTCVTGVCECPDDGLLCSGACVDEQTDNVNCGSCGNTCTDGKTCVAGECTCTEAGTTDCDGLCVDLNASADHCGTCGHECVGLETCDEGVCYYDVGDDCGGAAKNVGITKVALYQAVEAKLFDAGQTVPTGSRAVDVIQGKEAVVRVHLDVGSGFVARDLSARVYLDNGGEQAEAFYAKKQVSVDSSDDNFGSTLNVSLPAEKLQAGTEYYVELVECGTTGTGTVGVTRVPATGQTPLEARKTGAIRIAFLPFRYNGMLPDTSATALQRYADEVKKQFGTTEVITSVLPEYGNFSGTPNLSSLLNDVRSKRQSDAPTANVYYYGLVKSTSSFNTFCQGGCTTGVAYVATGAPSYRAGIGIGFGDGVSAGTFAHELGHNHGRDHAPCGTSGDTSYPHSGGGIGVWGLDLSAAQLKNPSQYKDLMSYCSPTWVSDYNYNAMADEIAAVNGSFAANELNGEPGPLETWDAISVTKEGPAWTFPQEMETYPPEARVTAVVFDARGDAILEVDAYRIALSESLGYLLLVPPRRSGWYAIGLDGDAALPYP